MTICIKDIVFSRTTRANQDFEWKRCVVNGSATTWGALRAVAPRYVLAPLDLAALRKRAGGVLNREREFAIRVGLGGDGAWTMFGFFGANRRAQFRQLSQNAEVRVRDTLPATRALLLQA